MACKEVFVCCWFFRSAAVNMHPFAPTNGSWDAFCLHPTIVLSVVGCIDLFAVEFIRCALHVDFGRTLHSAMVNSCVVLRLDDTIWSLMYQCIIIYSVRENSVRVWTQKQTNQPIGGGKVLWALVGGVCLPFTYANSLSRALRKPQPCWLQPDPHDARHILLRLCPALIGWYMYTVCGDTLDSKACGLYPPTLADQAVVTA